MSRASKSISPFSALFSLASGIPKLSSCSQKDEGYFTKIKTQIPAVPTLPEIPRIRQCRINRARRRDFFVARTMIDARRQMALLAIVRRRTTAIFNFRTTNFYLPLF